MAEVAVLGPVLAVDGGVEGDGAGDAADRQVARHDPLAALLLDARRHERERRERLDVEEVGRAQVGGQLAGERRDLGAALANLATALSAVNNFVAANKQSVEKVADGVWMAQTDQGVNAAWFLAGESVFAIDAGISKRWWVKPFLALTRAIPLDPTKPLGTRTLVNAVKAGETLVIFPEGRLTVTGSLMKVYDGAALIADKADAEIVNARQRAS